MAIGDIIIQSVGSKHRRLIVTIAEVNAFPREQNHNRFIVAEVNIWCDSKSRIEISAEFMQLAQLKIIAESLDAYALIIERLTEADVGKVFPYNARAREMADTLSMFERKS